jgi:trehalose-6-phosphate hydrolase
MLDIVVNHTSIEHEWFQQARSSLDNPYRDFYIWRDQPNNWESKFGGSAWEYEAQTGQYYLHLFDHTQADLNWDNPKVRAEVYKLMCFWRDKGVGGFRLDVINLISKPAHFPQDDSDGRRFYTDGPNVHEYLQEMHREVFAGHDLVSVGEMSSTSLEHCIRYSRPDSEELSMTFNFHHLKVDYPNMQKWQRLISTSCSSRASCRTGKLGMQAGGGWNALFWCNHDQPRVVSRFGDDGEHRVVSAKMLATALHFLQGTPYVYQGEELGMTNPGFDISSSTVMSKPSTSTASSAMPVSHEASSAWPRSSRKSRDNGRTPMQWDSSSAQRRFQPRRTVARHPGQCGADQCPEPAGMTRIRCCITTAR